MVGILKNTIENDYNLYLSAQFAVRRAGRAVVTLQ